MGCARDLISVITIGFPALPKLLLYNNIYYIIQVCGRLQWPTKKLTVSHEERYSEFFHHWRLRVFCGPVQSPKLQKSLMCGFKTIIKHKNPYMDCLPYWN